MSVFNTINEYTSWPPSKFQEPRQVEHGIQLKKSVCEIAENWWSQRWLKIIDEFGLGVRWERAKQYASRGQVISIEIENGLVKSSVQGSDDAPYRVMISVKTIPKPIWMAILQDLGKTSSFAIRLASRTLPPEEQLSEVFQNNGVLLFPDRQGELHTKCTCLDWSNPCKHVAAVYLLLAAEFDRDPFLLFKLRGLEQNELFKLTAGKDYPIEILDRSSNTAVVDNANTKSAASSEILESDRDYPIEISDRTRDTATVNSTNTQSATPSGILESGKDYPVENSDRSSDTAIVNSTNSESAPLSGILESSGDHLIEISDRNRDTAIVHSTNTQSTVRTEIQKSGGLIADRNNDRNHLPVLEPGNPTLTEEHEGDQGNLRFHEYSIKSAHEQKEEEPAQTTQEARISEKDYFRQFWKSSIFGSRVLGQWHPNSQIAALPTSLGEFPFWQGRENFLERIRLAYQTAPEHAKTVLVKRKELL